MANNVTRHDGLGGQITEKTTETAGVHVPHVIVDSGGGGATTIADGADVNQGTTTDAAITTSAAGTLSGKLRGIIALLVSLFKSEDAAHASSDVGVMALAVRNDAGTTLAGTDGDYIPLSIDANGALRVTGGGGGTEYTEDAAAAANPVGSMQIVRRRDTLTGAEVSDDGDNIAVNATAKGELYVKNTDGDALLTTATASLSVLDDWDESDRAKVNVIAGQAGVTAGAGSVAANTPRVTLASDDPAVASLSVLDDWDNTASDGVSVSGDVAHDAADAGEPVKIGGKAVSAEPAAVAANDRVNAIFDLVGKQIIAPYTNPENIVSGAITSAMTGTTSTSLVAAPGAGLRNYITTIIVSNAHATVGTDVAIQDGSGGTTLLTIPAAAVYGGAVINLPVPLRQPTTNTAIFCANVTTGASTKVSAVGYKGV